MKTTRYAPRLLLACVLGTAVPFANGGLARAAGLSPAGLPDFSALVEQAGPAVVNVRTTRKVAERGDDDETPTRCS